MENLNQILFKKISFPMELQSTGFSKLFIHCFFHASYVSQDVLLVMLLFLITKKLLFPVHPFQFQLLWNRYKR